MDTGVMGPVEVFNERRLFAPESIKLGLLDVELARDCLRCGVDSEEADRDREETVRGRASALGLRALGVRGVVGLCESGDAREAAVAGVSSSSVHCRCKMTDFVAHC